MTPLVLAFPAIDPEILRFGPFALRWYALAYIAGIVLGWRLALRLADAPPRVVLDGFEVAADSHHNFANGLRFGPDGWLYGRCGGSCPGRIGPPGTPAERRVRLEGGIWRLEPRSGRFEVLVHGMTNSWGHDWNEFGDGFCINTVTGHLWQIIPGAHYPFNGRLDPNPYVYEPIATHADHDDLLAGRTTGREVWKALNAANRVGVTRGTLEEKRNPLALL